MESAHDPRAHSHIRHSGNSQEDGGKMTLDEALVRAEKDIETDDGKTLYTHILISDLKLITRAARQARNEMYA